MISRRQTKRHSSVELFVLQKYKLINNQSVVIDFNMGNSDDRQQYMSMMTG